MACMFDKCCICIDLRTGCLVIGYLNLVIEIIAIALSMLALLAGGAVAGSASSLDKQVDREAAAAAGTAIMAVVGILLLVLFVLLAFTIVLLVGIHQNKRGHVRAYLIYSYIFMVIGVLGFFAMFAGPFNAVDVIKNLVSLLLFIYFTLVIRSYYHKMDDRKRPQIYNAA